MCSAHLHTCTTGEQGELTKPLGEQMSELPIHPTLAKMLLSSAEMGCSQEIVTIIAMLQVHSNSLKSLVLSI